MNWIEQFQELNISISKEVVFSIIIIAIITLLKWGLNRFIQHKIDDAVTRYKWRKVSTYSAVILGFIFLLPIWFGRLQSLATFFGLFTAGLAIALRDLLSNLVGWLFIIWKRPFSIGDRIQVDEQTAGDVIDIRIFQFSLIEIGQWVEADQSTGRVVHVPNSKVLTGKVANYTAGFSFIWNELPVLITFESNWQKAKQILDQIVIKQTQDIDHIARDKIRQASRKFLIYYGKLTPIIYTRVKESGILLTIRYLCEPQKRRTTEGFIWEEILRAFAGDDEIEFAYPTQRFYVRENEQVVKNNQDFQPFPGNND